MLVGFRRKLLACSKAQQAEHWRSSWDSVFPLQLLFSKRDTGRIFLGGGVKEGKQLDENNEYSHFRVFLKKTHTQNSLQTGMLEFIDANLKGSVPKSYVRNSGQ